MIEELFKATIKLKEKIPSLPISIVIDKEELGFEIEIGSKTGKGVLKLSPDKNYFIFETRYGQTDTIEFDEDIIEEMSMIAFHWYLDYKDAGYGPSSYWLPLWLEEGRIKENKKTVVEYSV